jgi:hypothetical protein
VDQGNNILILEFAVVLDEDGEGSKNGCLSSKSEIENVVIVASLTCALTFR